MDTNLKNDSTLAGGTFFNPAIVGVIGTTLILTGLVTVQKGATTAMLDTATVPEDVLLNRIKSIPWNQVAFLRQGIEMVGGVTGARALGSKFNWGTFLEGFVRSIYRYGKEHTAVFPGVDQAVEFYLNLFNQEWNTYANKIAA